jgi:hypothetical protein
LCLYHAELVLVTLCMLHLDTKDIGRQMEAYLRCGAPDTISEQ